MHSSYYQSKLLHPLFTTGFILACVFLCAGLPIQAYADNNQALTTGEAKSADSSQDSSQATSGNKDNSNTTITTESGSSKQQTSTPSGLKAGWNKLNGIWYYANKKGNALTGWQKVNKKWYYLDPLTGAMQTGWIRPDGKTWYFLQKSGAMQTGWLKRGKTWYYLKGSGAMATGWQKVKGKWYYLDSESGKMQTGWVQPDGKTWYYLYGSGAMASNAYVGKYYVAKSGAWSTDPWQKKANALSSSTNYVIIVDTKMNYTLIYKGKKGSRALAKSMQCTTGAASTPTVKGEFSILDRKPSFGDGSYVVWNATRFYGGYFFHSVLYYPGSKSSIKDGRLGMHLSHGCVRLTYANSRWIYNNMPNGTKVYVY